MEKYSDELNNIELFRYLYEDFPQGKLIRTESPDFIIKEGRRNVLGIEITHVIDETQAEKLSSDTSENRKKKRLLDYTRDIFEYNGGLKLNAAFYFKPGKVPPEGRLFSSAGTIARAISSKIEGRNSEETFHIHFSIKEVAGFLESVTIFRFPELSSAEWIDAGAFTLPVIEAGRIEKTINHKEEKLRIYQKKQLRYYWLLLITDTGLIHDGMPKVMEMIDVSESGFNKVFLIERRVGRLYELS